MYEILLDSLELKNKPMSYSGLVLRTDLKSEPLLKLRRACRRHYGILVDACSALRGSDWGRVLAEAWVVTRPGGQ